MDNKQISHLHAHGFRVTPQRLAILRILEEANGHLPPLMIYERAQQLLPGITEATVYRTLNFLVDQGLALAAHIGNGQLVYEIAGREHHHLICRRCGEAIEIDHQLLKDIYEELHQRTGFQIDCIHVTFFGLCSECQHNISSADPDRPL